MPESLQELEKRRTDLLQQISQLATFAPARLHLPKAAVATPTAIVIGRTNPVMAPT